MHFTTGELLEIFEENELRMGRVRVGGAVERVALTLVPEARVGDQLLTHAGVALARVRAESAAGESQPE